MDQSIQLQKSIQSILVVIAILLAVNAAGLFAKRVDSQAPAAHAPALPARYTLVIQDRSENVIDTQTGQVWWHDEDEVANGGSAAKWHSEAPLPVSGPESAERP